MSPEFVQGIAALLFFWEDFAAKVHQGLLPFLWKILLQTRTRLQARLDKMSDEQRMRLEQADAIIRAELTSLLQQEGCVAEYLHLQHAQDVDHWWYFLK